jgi:hypothetical protein
VSENIAIEVNAGGDLKNHQAIVIRLEHRALGDETHPLLPSQTSRSVVRALLKRRYESSMSAFFQDENARFIDLAFETTRGERAEKTDRFRILSDVDESAGAVRPAVKSADIHIALGVDLGE